MIKETTLGQPVVDKGIHENQLTLVEDFFIQNWKESSATTHEEEEEGTTVPGIVKRVQISKECRHKLMMMMMVVG